MFPAPTFGIEDENDDEDENAESASGIWHPGIFLQPTVYGLRPRAQSAGTTLVVSRRRRKSMDRYANRYFSLRMPISERTREEDLVLRVFRTTRVCFFEAALRLTHLGMKAF